MLSECESEDSGKDFACKCSVITKEDDEEEVDREVEHILSSLVGDAMMVVDDSMRSFR